MKLSSTVVGAVALVCACLTTPASASTYSSLVVFGDSLLDPGNAAALTRQADGTSFFPPTFPYNGRFTNGPNAAELLATRLGATTVGGWPDAAGANNFAVGGALSGNGNLNALVNSPVGLSTLFPAVADTGIAQQIARYNPAGLRSDDTLFMLWGGANDFFLGFAQSEAGLNVDFNGLVSRTLTNMATNLESLVSLGATHILVPLLPDLGLTPSAQAAGPSFAASATALTQAYNDRLNTVITSADARPGLQVSSFDTATFLQQTLAQTDGPFTQGSHSCLSGGAAALANHCAGYLFFDDVHPTDLGQALLAERFATAVGVSPVPEPQTWALMGVALLLLGPVALRRQRRLRDPQPQDLRDALPAF